MGLQFKATLNLCVLASALLLTACGKKDNKVGGTYSSGNPFTTGTESLNNSSAGQAIINQVQAIKSNLACPSGYRLANDVSFYATQGQMSGSRLLVNNWQPGFTTSGSINKIWVGVSVFKDLMFVSQVVDSPGSSRVVGFNVTLSFCEMKNGQYPSIISNTRELTGFSAPNGIVLDSDTYCGYSMVDSAMNTTIISRRDLNNTSYTWDARLVTTFTKAGCNGRY